MIIGSAPLRVSLLGGGSDAPDFFADNVGAVLGGSINKKVYVCVLDMVKSAEYPFRFTYRQVDNALEKKEIEHPVWRELLLERERLTHLNAATFSDIPGNSGLGSSSAFTVAGIAALDLHEGKSINPRLISQNAIRIERDVLREYGGWQDQLHSSFGGFRLYRFEKGNIKVEESLLNSDELEKLNQSTLLVKVGESRESGNFHSPIGAKFSEKQTNALKLQAELAIQGAEILGNLQDWEYKFQKISELVQENWNIKKSLGQRSTSNIDKLIEFGMEHGATAAKLCGAGGSGYVLFLGYPDGLANLTKKIQHTRILEFMFMSGGVEAIEV